MPNLLDVVKLAPSTKPTKSHPKIALYEGLASRLKDTSDFALELGLRGRDAVGIVGPVVDLVNKRLEEIRAEVFKGHNGHLPAELLARRTSKFEEDYWDRKTELRVSESYDSMSGVSESPRAALLDLRSIADRLCMVIMPIEYMTKQAYRGEERSVAVSVDAFHKAMDKTNYQTYVLAPIQYYSVISHVKAENPDMPVYAGRQGSIFMGVAMNIPMFRTILNDIEELRSKLTRIETTVSNVEKNIASMQRQIDALAAEVARQRQEALVAERRAVAAEAAAAEAAASLAAMSFAALDPLVIGIPSGTGPSGDATAVLGPCWGPDFPAIVAELNGLKVVKGQRAKVRAITDKYF